MRGESCKEARNQMECPRPLFGGRGQAARWLPLFCNQRDARVRVLRNSPTFYFRIKASFLSLFASLPSFLLRGIELRPGLG
jgi:hypothetical protein